MLKELLTPVESQLQDYFKDYSEHCLGKKTIFYDGVLPDVKKGVALIHVPEYRGAHLSDKKSDLLLFRKALYQLTEIPGEVTLIDMGDMKPGATLKDSKAALKMLCEELLEAKFFPLIVGGSHDLTYPQVHSLSKTTKTGLNLLIADQKIDFYDFKTDELSNKNFLMDLLSSSEFRLFDFNIIGHQMHYTNSEALHTIDKLNFEAYRLSELQSGMEEIEPIARDADILSIDMGVVRFSDATAVVDPTPNGLYGEQICQIMRYAGLSDRMKSIGLYGIDTDKDENGQTSQLLAQMIWYFLEARASLKIDFPDFKKRNFTKYSVNVEGTEGEMVFLKSKTSEKWWMEIPDLKDKTVSNRFVIPCSYSDYQLASNNEIPERWMKAFHKLN